MKTNSILFSQIIAGLWLLFFLRAADANMVIYPMQAEIGQSGAGQISVQSKSDKVQYVKLSVKKIINPGTPEEKEVAVDPTSEEALLATPQKLVLTAGAERLVRLVMLKAPVREGTWRVYFESIPEDDFTGSLAPSTDNTQAAKVGVSIIWGALIHTAPQTVHIDLGFNPQNGKLVNNGTLRIPLTEVAQCSSKDSCVWKKETATIYPGTQIKINSLKFENKQYKAKYFNWVTGKNEEIELPAL